MVINMIGNIFKEHYDKLTCLNWMKDIVSEYFKTTLPKRINNYYIKLLVDIKDIDDTLGERLYITIMAYNPYTKDKLGVELIEFPNMMFYWNLKHSNDKEVHTEMQIYKNHVIPTLQEMIVKLCAEIVSKPIQPMEGEIFEWQI